MIDLSSIATTTGPGDRPDAKALAAVAAQFEALFVQMLLDSAELPLGKEGASELYGDMANSAWSSELGGTGGFGIADLLVRALAETPEDTDRPEPVVRAHVGAARYRAASE